jgi:hypothetical protein
MKIAVAGLHRRELDFNLATANLWRACRYLLFTLRHFGGAIQAPELRNVYV